MHLRAWPLGAFLIQSIHVGYAGRVSRKRRGFLGVHARRRKRRVATLRKCYMPHTEARELRPVDLTA